MIRLAIAGKGGSGKTTIAGTLATSLARAGRRVVAVDADTNPNLAYTLGIAAADAQEVAALPRTLLERREQPDGTTKVIFTRSADEVLREFGRASPDGVELIVMGKVHHGGAG